MSSIIFYGAGQNAQENINRWWENGLRPVCFADFAIGKQHTLVKTPYGDKEVLSLLEAIQKYPDYQLYLTQNNVNIGSAANFLLSIGIPKDRIKYCDYSDDLTVAESQINFGSWKNLYLELNNIYCKLQDDLSKAHLLGRIEYSLTHIQTGMYRVMMQDDFIKWTSKYNTFGKMMYGINNLWQLLKDNYPVQKNEIYLIGGEDDINDYNWSIERSLQAVQGLGIKISGCVMPYSASGIVEFIGLHILTEDELATKINDNTRLIIGGHVGHPFVLDVIKRYSQYKDLLILAVDSVFPQYFDSDIFVAQENEIFVDVGVYDLGSSIDFCKWAKNGYEKIYAFEPDPNCYKNSVKRLNESCELDASKINIINKGLSSKSGNLKFPAEYNLYGACKNNDTIDVEVITLDEYLDGKPVTFVKMDVEGAEMDVLFGMKNTILNYKPRLAVCIYHKHEDILEITRYILSLVPEYKLWIRHYNTNELDEVLFCTL